MDEAEVALGGRRGRGTTDTDGRDENEGIPRSSTSSFKAKFDVEDKVVRIILGSGGKTCLDDDDGPPSETSCSTECVHSGIKPGRFAGKDRHETDTDSY